jgi:ferredoxin
MADPVKLNEQKSEFKKKVQEILPEGGNLDLCFTCGTCASGCPATGLENMDPRKFLRMVLLGMDDEVIGHPWAWMCTMCQRCIKACPMSVDIPQLVFYARSLVPREERPVGILKSCDVALATPTCSAMGATVEDWHFVVEDVAEEVRDTQPGFENLQAPMDKQGAKYYLNQNSREPVTEPDEMIPLWKILHTVGADWTYGSKGWAAENYCMFLADDDAWESIVRQKAEAVDELGCEYWLNTE